MTPADTVELLFRLRSEGAEEAERLAASVRNVGTAATLSADSATSLERAIAGLTTSVTANTAALNSMEGAAARTTTGLHAMGGGARVASAELRVLEGSMPIMAAGRFLAQMESVNAVMQVAFPVFGAIALAGVLDQIVDKTVKWANAHNPVIEAQKESLSLLEREGAEYDRLAKKAQDYRDKQLEAQYGKTFVDRLQAGRFSRAADQQDQDEINQLQAIISSVTRISTINNGLTSKLRPEDIGLDAQIRTTLGLKTSETTGLEWLTSARDSQGMYPTRNQATAAAESLPGLDQALQTARAKQQADRDDAAAKLAEANKEEARVIKEATRKREELENRIAGILGRSAKEIEAAVAGGGGQFVSGIDAAYAATQLELKRARESGASPTQLAQISRAGEQAQYAEKLRAHEWATRGESAADLASQPIPGVRNVASPSDFIGSHPEIFGGPEDFPREFHSPLTAPAGYMTAREQMRAARSEGSSMLREARRGEPRETATQKTDAEYSAQVAAINLIYDAEMRLAKNDDDRLNAEDAKKQKTFEAQQQREDQLEAIRERDLQKYQSLAGEIFDALHGHSMNQFGRNLVTGQARTLFSNVAQYPLQQIGHLFGSATGGANPGGILTGTILDPANGGNNVAKQTADNTKTSADWLNRIYTVISGQSTSDPAAANPVSASGGAVSALLAAAPGTIGGASTTTGVLSALRQFGSGLAGGPSAAFSALFPQSSGVGAASYGGSPITTTGGDGPLGDINWGNSPSQFTSPTASAATKAGQAASIGAAVATGVFTAISEFGKGGASGALGGVAALAGAASVIPGAGIVAAPVAAVAGILSSLLSTGPAQRQQQITDYIAKDAYLAPTALNVQQSMNGTYESFDARGNIVTSNMSAIPTVAEPYITKRTLNGQQGWYDAPGYQTSPYSGNATGTGQKPVSNAPQVVIQNLSAIDTQSGVDFIMKNHAAIGAATVQHLQSPAGERLTSEIQFRAGG